MTSPIASRCSSREVPSPAIDISGDIKFGFSSLHSKKDTDFGETDKKASLTL